VTSSNNEDEAVVVMGLCPACGASIPLIWESSVVCEGGGHHTVPLRPMPPPAEPWVVVPPPYVPPAPPALLERQLTEEELDREYRSSVRNALATLVFLALGVAAAIFVYWLEQP
jgi:hypothetical protein